MKKLILLIGLTLMLSMMLAQIHATDLFFSEYVEGSGNNKVLEIFNGTGLAVDMSQYTIKLGSNGGAWSTTNILSPTGSLANNDVFIIANADASPAILALADVTSTVTYFNGNDAVALFHGNTMIDIIGVYQADPGTAWDVAGTVGATLNHTLIRKPNVSQGNLNWAQSAGANPDNSEWIVHPQDYIANLGLHTFTPSIETLAPPTNLTAAVTGSNVHLTWTAPGGTPPPAGFGDGFETYPDFALTFAPWTLVDVDQYSTYSLTATTWPNAYAPMAYIIFNPSATVPPVTDMVPHTGAKIAACFAAAAGPNNDWLITPQISVSTGNVLKFWAKSYVTQYGLERFKVGVSTTGTDPANFTIISGASYISAPADWTEYTYQLNTYAGQQVYIGIQCLSNDAFIFMVDDVFAGSPAKSPSFPVVADIAGNGSRSTGVAISAASPATRLTRALLGYKIYRNGTLIANLTGAATVAYSDMAVAYGTYSYTVTANYNSGESVPAGPASATIAPALLPPTNLTAAVSSNDVTLDWDNPEPPAQGNWITWCQDAVGNSIGTNAAVVFDVAHRWTQADLAPYAGRTITQMKFVPAHAACDYTVKIWTGGSATAAGTLVSSQVVPTFIEDDWNLVILNTPVPIPTTGDLYYGFEVNTTGGFPAGCDNGPQIQGKGNMMYFEGAWTTLTALAATLTYNWSVKAFAQSGAASKAVELKPIVEHQTYAPRSGSLAAERFSPSRNDRAITGYKVYRNSALINTINDPGITIYTDMDLANGTYTYGVSAIYATGVSAPATVQAVVNVGYAPAIFSDGFEAYPNFAATFAPWTLIDVDQSATYGMTGIEFPGSAGAMAYIVFNPSATTPPITTVIPHAGAKMAASFAATAAPNSDWLITPRVQLGTGSAIKFYAKSHTATYGLERFRVGVSTLPTSIPQGFNYITGTNYVEAPVNWTEYLYDLSAYDGQNVYIGIRCVSNDAFVFYVDDFTIYSQGGGFEPDPFGNPVVLPSSMTVAAGLTINGQQAASGDVLAAFVNVNGTPQLRGKQTVQVINGIAGCLLQVFTQTNGEVVNFKVWDSSTDQVLDCPISLNTVVNGTVGEWPNNLFMIDAATATTQNIPLTTGWNLVSLNVSPANHTLASVLAPISALVQQVKGAEGVYLPGNPYSTLSSLSDGKAYNIQVNAGTTWSISGAQIPANLPLVLSAGWNMTAYLPQNSMALITAMQSISTWLQQVKGTDGVYIPGNPYSTLSTMYPGKGYWLQLTGAHSLVYPTGRETVAEPVATKSPIEVTKLPSSMVLLARCDWAQPGDILIARVNGTTRGAQELTSPEGFPAALLQIYTAVDNEEISLWLLHTDGTETELANVFISEVNATLGSYPDFIILEPQGGNGDVTVLPTQLYGCYPNPFNPSTTISFSVAEDNAMVSVNIYNLKGQKVRQLAHARYENGKHSLIWNGTDDMARSLSSGVYLIELKAGNYRKTAKAMLAK